MEEWYEVAIITLLGKILHFSTSNFNIPSFLTASAMSVIFRVLLISFLISRHLMELFFFCSL